MIERKKKALVAVGRSILVIIWHLLADPDTHFHDLGPDFYDSRISSNRKKLNHIHQLEEPSPCLPLTFDRSVDSQATHDCTVSGWPTGN